MKHNLAILLVLAVAGLFALAMGCSDDDNPVINNQISACNYDNVCDANESTETCEDCIVPCTLTEITGEGHDFLVSELYIPDGSKPDEDKDVGVDLNGDVFGLIDNKLGRIFSLIADYVVFDVNESVNQMISDGNLLLVGRVYVDQFVNDDAVLTQLLQAVIPTGGATPVFEGDDEVALDPGTPQDLNLCGSLENNIMEAGPGNLNIVLPISETSTLDITLEHAQIIGRVTADGMVDVMLGGGLSKEEIETNLYPTAVEYLNGLIQLEPDGRLADTVLGLLDNKCDSTQPGCDPLPGGCDENDVIDVDELTCNKLVNSVLAPDVDIDGEDLISIGLKIVEAVPVTVVSE